MIFPLAFFFLHVFLYFLHWSSVQSLIAHSQEKSRFLHEQKVEWDHLTEEPRLRGDVGAQLAAAQQREAEARHDVEEIHGMFEDLSVRVKLDKEEAAKI